jgi:hypothetical protein
MIRVYAAIGIVALIVGLGGYALVERSWRQLAVEQAASLKNELASATLQLEAERSNAKRAAALAAAQSKAAQEARQRAQTAEDRARALIAEVEVEPLPATPGGPACPPYLLPEDWRKRVEREMPVVTPPLPLYQTPPAE